MDESKKPILRFKGFTETWERSQLSDYLETSTEKNLDNYYTKQDVLSVSGEVGIVNQIEFQGRSFAGASVANYGVVHTGDVVYTKSPLSSNPFGIIKANKGKAGIVSTLYAVYHTRENIYPDFVQNYFEQNERLNNYLYPLVNKGAKNDMKVSDDNALKGEVVFPSYGEQKVISDYFSVLDKFISLQQRKYDKIVNVKKAMLEKMFPKNGSNTPEIRFKGFTDPWEQRKLGDIAERITRKNTELESTLPLTISAQYGLVDQITFFNNRIASKDVSGYYLLKKGEFAYNKSYSEGYPWGAVKRLERYEKGVLSTLYICFKLVDVNSNFLVSYYDTNNWYKEVEQRAAEGARNHGLLNISADDFFDTNLTIPKSKEEQAAIGCYFENLDKFITLHQRRLEKLRNIKSSCMEKMFV